MLCVHDTGIGGVLASALRRVPLVGSTVRVALVVILLAGCTAKQLPHREVNELTNWGQGHAPEANHCPPGTIRMETDGGFFVECFRGTNNEIADSESVIAIPADVDFDGGSAQDGDRARANR